jgi:hypothetical protein
MSDGMGFTAITYDFFGRIHDRSIESMVVVGLTLEVPIADRMLLSFRPAVTILNGDAGLAARVQTESETKNYRGFVDEQWIMEIPILAKLVLPDRELRPYFCAGGFVDINTKPAKISVTGDVDPAHPMNESYSVLSGGLMAAAGVEINVASILLVTFEFAVRQHLAPLIATEILTQHNNPRFLFSAGLLFPLSHERW